MNAISDTRGRPLHDLRISVTDRCNFRCPYCMPAEIYGEHYEFMARPELLTFEEIERLTRLFVELGVEKIRITGGEPLLRHQLPSLIGRLAAIDGLRDLTLTTNGFLLAKHAQALKSAGLDRITVSRATPRRRSRWCCRWASPSSCCARRSPARVHGCV